jgi:hypothetical protein
VVADRQETEHESGRTEECDVQTPKDCRGKQAIETTRRGGLDLAHTPGVVPEHASGRCSDLQERSHQTRLPSRQVGFTLRHVAVSIATLPRSRVSREGD